MKKQGLMMPIFLFAAILLFTGCGSTKGYSGTKLADSEVAVVKGGKHSLTIKNKKTKETAFFTKVDTITVGSFMKGWPKQVKVKPGIVTVEIRHFQQWKDKSATAGALFGVIGASIAESNNPHLHYKLTFAVEKGKSYLLMPETDETTLAPHFRVIDETTAQSIEPEVQEIANNKN